MDDLPMDVGSDSSQPRGPVVSLGARRPPGVFIVAALVLVVVLAVIIGSNRSSSRAAPPTTAPATTVREVTTLMTTTTVRPTTAIAPTTTTISHQAISSRDAPVLPALTKTELIIHGDTALERVDLDRGTVIVTPVPAIGSTAPTFMIAGSRSVLLRPLDNVTGYLVPDEGVPQTLTDRLEFGTLWAYPGPQPGLVWIEPSLHVGRPPQLALVSFETNVAETTVDIGNLYPWGPDGTGQVVLSGVGGVYVTGPGGLTRVTTGDMFAAGPIRWLVRECDEHHTCTIATIDRRTGRRTVLDGGSLATDSGPITGTTSPDGNTAAIMHLATAQLDVVDLNSGAQRNVAAQALRVDPVWSLDSRYLFFVDKVPLSVYDRTTGTSSELTVGTRRVGALAVRPAP